MVEREAVAKIDFETRSCADLKKVGTWAYSVHPSTEILCLAFRLPHWEEGRTGLWHPSFPRLNIWACDTVELTELFDWIATRHPVEAHNAFFERCMWLNVLHTREGWPDIAPWQWRCSAAKAAAHTLPRGLGDVAQVLKLRQEKDKEGHKLMLKLCKPRKPRQAELIAWVKEHGPSVELPPLWHESKEQFERLWAYCRQDVLTEAEVSDTVPPLAANELELFLIDQDINTRGFQLDADAVDAALSLVKRETPKLNEELCRLTDGAASKATQRAKMLAWFAGKGLSLPNTQKDTIEEALCTPRLTIPVRRGLELMQMLGKASTAKYQSMRNWMDTDGRVRGGLLFHGAGPLTGDHECLTPTGWVRIDQWAGGLIACWAPDERVQFLDASVVSRQTHTLSHLSNGKLSQVSTPDHAMPAFTRQRTTAKGASSGGQFVRRTVETLAHADRIPLYGRYAGGPSPLTELQLRILVMTQADAHYVLSNGRCVRYRFKKPRKIARCKQLLDAAGILYQERVDACDGVTVLSVPYANAPSWLWGFSDKTFPWTWLDVDADVLFEELQHWDGCQSSPNGQEYTSTNKQNTDVVQALAHLSGRTCKVRSLHRPGWSTAWRCAIDREPAPVTFRKEQRHSRSLATPVTVYCAQTAIGYFLVRRKGRVWVTGNTGRWSGAGVQPQNFVRSIVKDMPTLWAALKTQDRIHIQRTVRDISKGKVTDVLAALSQALRGVIIAPPGKRLYVADYAAIEARCLLWLAEDEKSLDIFRRGEDIYVDTASSIYNIAAAAVTGDQRQMGKQAVLGLGYQMGWRKFQATCAKYRIEITDEFAQRVVDAYRVRFWRTVKLWKDSEQAAIEAVLSGDVIPCGRVSWFVDGDYLYCELPSGRRLAYPEPEVRDWPTSWGDEKTSLTFTGINPYNRKWVRRAAYGGLIVENLTQAVARDLMAHAIQLCENAGPYSVVLSVHDELIAEADFDKGSVYEFTELMSRIPPWAAGCPVKAEGWTDTRYRK